MAEIARIRRSQFATWLNISATSTPSYSRFGKGIEEQNIAYNPETETSLYIDQDNPDTDLMNYAPSFDTTQRTFKGEPIFEYMYGKMRARAVGTDAQTDYLKVYMFDKLADGVYMAERCSCTVSINEFQGSEISYTINENGDPVIGFVTIVNGNVTFTAGTYTAG